jgi:predicted signal transduction protein with EAL and GGDEF domain
MADLGKALAATLIGFSGAAFFGGICALKALEKERIGFIAVAILLFIVGMGGVIAIIKQYRDRKNTIENQITVIDLTSTDSVGFIDDFEESSEDEHQLDPLGGKDKIITL